MIIIGGATAAVVLLSLLVLLVTGSGNAAPAPSQVPLPIVSAQDVISYLRLAGVPVLGIRSLSVPNETWGATQEFQFDVQRGDQKGIFLVLSYPSPGLVGMDSFSARLSKRFKGWQQLTRSNILLLISPDSAKAIGDEITNHVSQYTTAPYRAYIATSTGQPVIALSTSAAATSTAMASVTAQATFATLPPRTPEQTASPTTTPTRPTNAPTQSATPPPPTQTPTASATVIDSTASAQGETPSQASTDFIVMTPVASITASGPLLEPQIDNAQTSVTGAPQSVGPFSLDKASSTIDAHRSTLSYRTDDGQDFLVVLWITNSAREALDHYRAETSMMSGAQPVAVGDEAVITPPGNSVLAEMRYRNTVLVIYRPEQSSPVSPKPIADDQVVALVQALFDALPR